LKPVYKSIYDLRIFFNFLKIKIAYYYYEDFEPIIEEIDCYPDGILPPGWPFPGLHIYLNGLEASLDGNYLFNSEFKQYFDHLRQNILIEIKNNIKCSTSGKELISYLTELRAILKNCDNKIVENRVNTSTGIQCNYSYKGSEIERSGFDNYPEVEKISKEYLSDLLYWIQNQIRDLIIQTDNASKSIEPIVKGAKMIKSFEFTNPKYLHVKIASVFSELRDHEFIDKKTKLDQLELVFNNVTIDKPIKWIGYDGDLKVLIHTLLEKGIIINPKRSIWDKTRICFIREDGSLFKNKDLRGIKDTLRANEIKSIVNLFLD
jgi:hypothetical protein